MPDREGRQILMLDNCFLSYPYPDKPHTHNMLELSLAKEGSAAYVIGRRKYPIRAGDVYIIDNREMHKIYIEKGETLVNMVIHFEPEFLWSFSGKDPDYRFLRAFFSRGDHFSNRLNGGEERTKGIAKQLLSMERILTEKKPYYDLRAKALMENLLLDVLCGFDYFEAEDAREITSAESERMREVITYISLNVERPLTLQELSKIACLSPAYFSTLFKKYNGVTLIQYISRKRVEHAIQLIRATDLSLTEIAGMCGFNNSASFNKAFQRIRGVPPSHFRKNPEAPVTY